MTTGQPFSFSRSVLWGVVASFVMGTPMILETFVGEGFFAPMIYIAAMVLRGYQSVGDHPSFDLVPVLAGMVIHVATSVGLTVPFALLAPRVTRRTPGLVGLGIGYGVSIVAVMWLVVFPWADPVMLRLSGALFLISHVVWGGFIGVATARWIPPAAARG